MRRRFVSRQRSGARPSRVWAGISGQWLLTTVAVTTAVELVSMQAPTTLVNMTSDPPEDMTILRMVGDFTVAVGTAAGSWTLALLVQDTAWTPGATFLVDSDKRMLWSQSYYAAETSVQWLPPGNTVTATQTASAVREATRLDITPKVKVEAGKALYLVAYENTNGSTLTTASANMRLLMQRTRRRS